jgi:uncharacterized protein YbbC (DUF1343 family)
MRAGLPPRRSSVRTGLDQLLARPSVLHGLKLGLVANPASVTRSLEPAAIALRSARGLRLRALFGPEHGVWADAQDLVEVKDSRDARTRLPVHSLYGRTRVPTAEMLAGLDAVVFDMQDVGARYYTFAYTLLHVLEACAHEGRRVVVLDRPNPLGGALVEGNILDPSFASFVGLHPLPVRHGLTLGELALLFREERGLDVDLTVIRMKGWRRAMHFEETGLPWVMPSPNMPTVDTAFVYPGGCLVEGTNLSEGRGTTRPFELVGAPYIVAHDYAAELNRLKLPGVLFRSCVFRPTFQKHAGASCGGVQIHVLDRSEFEPVTVGVAMVKVAYDMYTENFRWKEPPYEYVYDRNPFDVIAGTARVREAIEQGTTVEAIVDSWQDSLKKFMKVREQYLLY